MTPEGHFLLTRFYEFNKGRQPYLLLPVRYFNKSSKEKGPENWGWGFLFEGAVGD